jgi:CRISPR/Cas system endoribonuclease Cas6 (RAMP superfamily)
MSLSLLLLVVLFPFFHFFFFEKKKEKKTSLTVAAAVVLGLSSGSVGSLRRFSRFLLLERERGVCEILGGVDHRRILEEEEEEVPEFLCLSGVATFIKTFQRWIFFFLSLSLYLPLALLFGLEV